MRERGRWAAVRPARTVVDCAKTGVRIGHPDENRHWAGYTGHPCVDIGSYLQHSRWGSACGMPSAWEELREVIAGGRA
jgi:hypothetical protein